MSKEQNIKTNLISPPQNLFRHLKKTKPLIEVAIALSHGTNRCVTFIRDYIRLFSVDKLLTIHEAMTHDIYLFNYLIF